MQIDRQPLFVECSNCHHIWIALYLPMALSAACEITQHMRCPMCATDSREILIRFDKRSLGEEG